MCKNEKIEENLFQKQREPKRFAEAGPGGWADRGSDGGRRSQPQ